MLISKHHYGEFTLLSAWHDAASSAKSDAQTLEGSVGASVCSTKINMKKTSLMKFGSMIAFALSQLRWANWLICLLL